MSDTVVDQVSREEWEQAASAFADYGVYHTWEYGQQRAIAEGGEVSRAVVKSEDGIIGLAQCRIRRIAFTGMGIAYVHWGPLWRRAGASMEDCTRVMTAVRREYAERRGLLLRVVPHVFRDGDSEEVVQSLVASGMRCVGREKPYRTFLLDLSAPLAGLRSGMARRWKRALKRGEAGELEIVAGDADDLFELFLPLYEEMRGRKGFDSAVDPHQFRSIQRGLGPSEKMLILIASLDGCPVAGLISSWLGDTCLGLLGASNEAGRKSQAAYVLHWENIQRAKEAGFRWYDLGGIDSESNPQGHLFKAGLGGVESELLGEFEACDSKGRETVVALAERAYRWATGLRR